MVKYNRLNTEEHKNCELENTQNTAEKEMEKEKSDNV